MDMSETLLSLCMIVKDEEAFIGQCLNSVQDAVDEIIVVDTGSTDQTKEVAKSCGAQVYEFAWTGNFSEARNYSIAKANGEWILWMDADEMLEKEDAIKLREGVRTSQKNILLIQLLNYVGKDEPNRYQLYTMNHHRLFRNNQNFEFTNAIHEQLHAKRGKIDEAEVGLLPVRIYHFGYLEVVVQQKRKYERNMSMLKELEKSGTDNPWLYYHIASEYYRMERYQEAFVSLNKAIPQFLSMGQLPPSMLYHMKYSILIAAGSLDSARKGIEKALQIYPDYVDLHFYHGVILFKLHQYAEALEAFMHCIEMGDFPSLHVSKKGTGSFYAYFYMGLTSEALGAYELAKKAYQSALDHYPNFPEVRERLHAIGKMKSEGGE